MLKSPIRRQALDVGDGEGAGTLFVRRLGGQVTAIDVSQIACPRGGGLEIHDRIQGRELSHDEHT